MAARVERALEALPPHYRLVLIWHERQGMTFAQIARALGRSEPAVRKLWSRALLALHDAMMPSHHDDQPHQQQQQQQHPTR
jgi:RNA polymerase sigma factor (sigma-70 family)